MLQKRFFEKKIENTKQKIKNVKSHKKSLTCW